MKVKLIRAARIRHDAGEIVEVFPAEAGFLLSTGSAVPYTEPEKPEDEKEKENPEAEAEKEETPEAEVEPKETPEAKNKPKSTRTRK